MIASYFGHAAVVQLLLKVPGVDANIQDDQVRPYQSVSVMAGADHLCFSACNSMMGEPL